MRVVGLQTHIWKNNFRSLFLLCMFPVMLITILFLIMFAVLGSESSSLVSAFEEALTGSILISPFVTLGVLIWFLIAWGFHKSMIMKMTGAKGIEKKDYPELYQIVEELTISRGLPMPKLSIIEDDSLNAFATGLSPKNSMIAFSRGLLKKLNKQEIEAVAAHELSHIINRDIRVMVISIIFVGIIQTVAEVFLRSRIEPKSGGKNSGNGVLIILLVKVVVFVLAFLISLVIQLAISRKREYLADAGSVELTKSSATLISALRKISQDSRIEAIENKSVAQMCIEMPLEKKTGWFEHLFATHPPIEDRIRVLSLIG